MERLQITLASARVNAGLTQEMVAKRMNVSKVTIISWEKGRVKPSLANLEMLARIYGISIDDFSLDKKFT